MLCCVVVLAFDNQLSCSELNSLVHPYALDRMSALNELAMLAIDSNQWKEAERYRIRAGVYSPAAGNAACVACVLFQLL